MLYLLIFALGIMIAVALRDIDEPASWMGTTGIAAMSGAIAVLEAAGGGPGGATLTAVAASVPAAAILLGRQYVAARRTGAPDDAPDRAE